MIARVWTSVLERQLAREQAEVEKLRAALRQIAVWPGDRKLVASICEIALGRTVSEPPPIHVYPVGEGHEMSENCWCHPKVHPAPSEP